MFLCLFFVYPHLNNNKKMIYRKFTVIAVDMFVGFSDMTTCIASSHKFVPTFEYTFHASCL